MRPIRRFLGLVALMFALPAATVAADELTVGDLTMHFNAVPTTTVAPEVARQYGITRSASRALLNVAVRRKTPEGQVSIPAGFDASATNLNGQRQEIALREVREGDAIYYLGEVRVTDRETLVFEIKATVDGRPMQATFQQQFFVAP
jgi:hypothetical protein